jgi:hypothetical protein
VSWAEIVGCCPAGMLSVIVLMMESVTTSETSVNFYQTKRRNIPEDSHMNSKSMLAIIMHINGCLKLLNDVAIETEGFEGNCHKFFTEILVKLANTVLES